MTISPYERARKVYEQEDCRRSFSEDLELHLRYGYVYSTPNSFIMGRAVDRYADSECIVDPSVVFDHPNAWLVYLAAGDMSEFFLRQPFFLPWVGWERENKLRFYKTVHLWRFRCFQLQ